MTIGIIACIFAKIMIILFWVIPLWGAAKMVHYYYYSGKEEETKFAFIVMILVIYAMISTGVWLFS